MSVAQLCLTLCDPMDYNSPGSFVHGIFQARIMEWAAISFSRGSSLPNSGLPHCGQILYCLSHTERFYSMRLLTGRGEEWLKQGNRGILQQKRRLWPWEQQASQDERDFLSWKGMNKVRKNWVCRSGLKVWCDLIIVEKDDYFMLRPACFLRAALKEWLFAGSGRGQADILRPKWRWES